MAKKKSGGKPPKPDRRGPKGKGSPGTSRGSKLPRPVQGRGFATFGLIALVPIAVLLLEGKLDLEAAAQRSVIVLVGLMLLERVVAPVVMAVLHSGTTEKDEGGADDAEPATQLRPADS